MVRERRHSRDGNRDGAVVDEFVAANEATVDRASIVLISVDLGLAIRLIDVFVD